MAEQVLIYADTVRSPELRHEIPLLVGDPFLYAERDGSRYVLTNVLEAKRNGGRSGVLICGGGSPKNFMLQTEPQIQEVLGLPESGHDYFLQITDARPDTGGLSGATPQEAMTWGKVDPAQLPDTVTCYLDSTVALPLITAYARAQHAPRKQRRLMDRRQELTQQLEEEYTSRRQDGSTIRKNKKIKAA